MKLAAWLNQARRPFGVQEPSHKHTHARTAKHSGPIDADGEGRAEVRGGVTERVEERQTDRQRVRSVEHAVD